MVLKYQNEIVPIFYYGKQPKTSGKLLKIVMILSDYDMRIFHYHFSHFIDIQALVLELSL